MCAKKVITVTKSNNSSANKDKTNKTNNGKGSGATKNDPLISSPPTEAIMGIISRFISLLPTDPSQNEFGVAKLSFYLGDTIMPYIFRGDGSDPEFIFYEGLSVNDQFKPSINRVDINPSVLSIMVSPFTPGDTL